MPRKDTKSKHKTGLADGGGPSKTDASMKKRLSKSTNVRDTPESGGGGDADEHGSSSKLEEKVGPPEWDSETVRNTNLYEDGFKCCTVMIMEDSPELSKYGEYLLRAVETGIRKGFACVSGAQTSDRVKRYLVATGQREPTAEDLSYLDRHDVFAEAIKFNMMSIKESVHTEMETDVLSKEIELSGARSKEYVRLAPPVTLTNALSEAGEGKEPPPPPPPSVIPEPAVTLAPPANPHKKGKGKGKETKAEKELEAEVATSTKASRIESKPHHHHAAGSGPTIGIKTRMRKRGEVPMPELEVIDDAPPKGPQCYILLQGFYNPKVLVELVNIGVKIEGILLMTDEKITRHNFSILDVEDSIPGTFRPKIVLPQYLKALEKTSQMSPEDDPGSAVRQFWMTLAEMYNSAPSDSFFHDIALMNVKMPEIKSGLINQMDSPEGMTFFISKLFDEVSNRIYEMLVFEEWHQEFTQAAEVNQIHPPEPSLPHDIYDRIVGQIPSECMSVSIILEALVQQVAYSIDKEAGIQMPEPCYDGDVTQGIVTGKSNFGQTNWGVAADGGKKKGDEPMNEAQRGLFMIPMYIKAGDYASIRSCHLNESLASKIASCQLSGDMRNIQGFLWHNVPEFNRGLHMKLLGNLNHFMYFMPPDLIRFDDMFYVLHLLMSAGIEIHLQKQANSRNISKTTSSNEMENEAEPLLQDAASGSGYYDGEERRIPGTNLSAEHNYFARNDKTGMNFVITPDSNAALTVTTVVPQAQQKKPESSATARQVDVDKFLKETQEKLGKSDDTGSNGKERKKRKSKTKTHELDPTKVARVATVGAIETAAEHVQENPEYKEQQDLLDRKKKGKKKKKMDKDEPLSPPPGESTTGGEGQTDGGNIASWATGRKTLIDPVFTPTLNNNAPEPQEEKKFGFENLNPSKDKKRFIACEEEWFEDMQDVSVIQALLECPALLAISESGALDLTKWIEKYLFSCGVEVGEGGLKEGVILGDLKNWNYVEELVPIQTVQMLNEATHEYLSMQRMYCPFYDTLLFIFNNPMPKKLSAESNFYCKLRTLPGLQHFLEYSMTDNDVIKWVERLEASKRMEVADTYSIQNLLSIIPDEQWLLVPSIKYQVMSGEQMPLKTPDGSPVIATMNATPATGSVTPGHRGSAETASAMSRLSDDGRAATATGVEAPAVEPVVVVEQSSPTPQTPGSAEADKHAEDPPPSPGNSKRNSKSSSMKSKGKSDKASQKSAKTETDKGQDGEGSTKAKSVSEKAKSIGSVNQSSPPISASEGDNLVQTFQNVLNFTCYDLGKRVAVVGNDTYFLFPVDGTIIRYDISTIEPEFRMMQLSVSKNGHQTFFYPYYVPRDFDLSAEDYVVCPYFHMILNNGTIFAFQDMRAEEADPYKVNAKDKPQDQQVFTFEKVLFGKEVEQKLHEATTPPERGVTPEITEPVDRPSENEDEEEESRSRRGSATSKKSGTKEQLDVPEEVPLEGKKTKKGLKEKKSKRLHDKEDGSEEPKKKKDKKKEKKKGKGKDADLDAKESQVDPPTTATPPPSGEEDEGEGEEAVEGGGGEEDRPPEINPVFQQGATGEWMYPSSENSDDETEAQSRRRLFFAPPWDDAAIIIQAMTHIFKVTLPSGLLIQVDDLPGPPLLRVVKQSYIGHGSARSQIESSRYYTMDGSVLKFLFNGNIQILTARGVTTNIDELAANAARETDDLGNAFGAASVVKIFNGEVILPNGQHWDVRNGKKENKNPIYVYTSGPLSGGEVFRRRQDGMICLHRFDGTVITHYPDGTRFTTRMVICENYDTDDFPDWVFVGLKYMIEHPNYSTVLFNTLSGNVHLKLPYGEWVRVFSDGNIRISTEDDYKLDVDKNRAILTYPPCFKGPKALPNITAVRLWHSAVSDGTEKVQQVDEPQKEEVPVPEPASVSPSQAPVPSPQEDSPKEEDPSSPPPATESGEPEVIKPVKKEKSRKTMQGIQRAKSLHPKIRQRDAIKRTKSTRMSAINLPEKQKSPVPEGQETPPEAAQSPNDINANDIPDRESIPFIPINPEEPSAESLNEPAPITRKGSFIEDSDALAEFLKFTDETTFCKCVDSWDNRFVMNLYGVSLVDKVEKKEDKQVATEKLLAALSEHSNLPRQFLSGILRNTSSANLETVAKRFQALKTNYKDTCGNNLPKTKIFVVKRDLTGLQYLQKSQVDEAVTKAYGSKESMVIVDPLPQRQPRKFITVMRPVEEVEDPHGMWTRPYIEPMFRPRIVTNKHLTVATPNDLRWFGYILNSAHVRRPKFVPEPKEVYKEMKARALQQRLLLEAQQQETETDDVEGDRKSLGDPRESVMQVMNVDEINLNKDDPNTKLPSPVRSIDEEEIISAGDELEPGEEEEQVEIVEKLDDEKKKKKKKDKDKEKDKAEKGEKEGKKKKRKQKGSPGNTSDEEEGAESEDSGGKVAANASKTKKSSNRFFDLEPEIAEYPNDIQDIRGIYEAEAKRISEAPRIAVKHHTLPCNQKRAIVVRAFVEIPKVDENVQRALLAASMSYAETCRTEAALYGTYKTEDPRSAEEKKAQTELKQQMIEQNIEDMHLLEQKPGPVLRFHF